MPHPFYQIDAFADGPFTGNPAAVVLLDAAADAEWMQAVAQEMNLAETAFLYGRDGEPGEEGVYGLRWFTPTVEVDLCGHATLAAAHALYEAGLLAPDAAARFDTASGRLTVRRAGAAGLTMDFPSTPPVAAAPPPLLAETLGAWPQWMGTTPFDLFAVLDSETAVRGLAPDMAAVEALGAPRGLIVTARADVGVPYDFVSRFFAPAAGVPEDPVTGSAHCALAPYWAGRLSRTALVGFQASARGGRVSVRVAGDRVELTGRAVTVVRGEMTA
ncbi:MAG TPA: PhzF family phenazine biosynthesis protein [Rhodothermales bacterium]|nr:PhzF family phenazine biosynthesis protein [Rhodothermales bacterium]